MKFIIEQTKLRSANNAKTSNCKVAPSRRLKNLLKPLLKRIFSAKSSVNEKRNSYQPSEEEESAFDWLHNELDNYANEALENTLLEEVQRSNEGDAIIVFDDCGKQCMTLVDKDHFYVPVRFASSDNGTFYWTSIQRQTLQPYNIQWHFADRWAQA